MIPGQYQSLIDRLRTVHVVSATAFSADGALALEPMRKLWTALREAGVTVFVPCAGSAEFHSLVEEEIVTVIRAARQLLDKQSVVIAPIGGALLKAIDLGKRCLDVGADALLVMPLDFPYVSDPGAYDYYSTLLEKLCAPILIYKKNEIPSDSLLLSMSEGQHFIGVKYAMVDIAAFQKVVDECHGRLAWYCGIAERYAPYFMLAGAAGYTSGAANICPRISLAMHAALVAGQWEAALRWQRVLLPIEYYRARSGNSYNVTMLKYALRVRGLDFGHPRPPQRRLTPQEMAEIDQLLQPIMEVERQLESHGG